MKTAMWTTMRKAETMARTRRDVDVDGGDNVGAGGNVDDSEDGDGAGYADAGTGGGAARRHLWAAVKPTMQTSVKKSESIARPRVR